MRAQLMLEFKKQPWYLYLLWVTVLSIMLLTPMLEVRNYQNGYTTTNQQIRHFEQSTNASLRAAKRAIALDKNNITAKVAVRGQKRIVTALHKEDYAKVNELLLTMIRQQPGIIKSGFGQNYYAVSSGGAESIESRLEYMVKHNLNRLIQVDYDSTALNVLGIVFKSDDVWAFADSAVEIKITIAFVMMAAITFCYTFWYGSKNGNDDLLAVMPIAQNAVTAIRIFLVAFLMELSLLLSALIITVLYGTGMHELGALMYPVIISLHQQSVVIPLLTYFGQLLVYFGLWSLLIGVLTWIFRSYIFSKIISLGLVITLTCLKPLGIMAVIPLKIAKLLPGMYLQPSMILHQGIISVRQFSGFVFAVILVVVGIKLVVNKLLQIKSLVAK